MRREWLAALVSVGLLGWGVASNSAPKTTAKQAAQRAIPLLQHSAALWTERTNCFSCHHQGLGQLALAIASENGLKVDTKKLKADIQAREDGSAKRLQQYEGTGAINGVAGFGFWLWGRSANHMASTYLSDSTIHYLLGKQAANGMWPSLSHRPPLEDSPVTLTAVAVRALQQYTPPYLSNDAKKATQEALAWLEKREPRSNEEAAFKVFGLVWAGASQESIRQAADKVASRQLKEGGWAQLPSRKSDAYATGQSLAAIALAGGSTKSQSYQKGIDFLIRTQKPDGSWHVSTRRKFPGLRYLETGFPHKVDQFISYAGTAWAVAALSLADGSIKMPGLKMGNVSFEPRDPGRLAENQLDDRLLRAAISGNLKEMKVAVEAGANVNARSKSGATPLMYAVRNSAKVQWLLDEGADPNAVSQADSTALLLAADTRGAIKSVRLLIKAGAKPNVVRDGMETPLMAAAQRGEMEMVQALLQAGAVTDGIGRFALPMAVTTEQYEVAAYMAQHGADINTPIEKDGTTGLDWGITDGDERSVKCALSLGAKVDKTGIYGLSPLHIAAMVDPGSTAIVDLLLKAGADPAQVVASDKTPLSLAKTHGNHHLAKAIEAALKK